MFNVNVNFWIRDFGDNKSPAWQFRARFAQRDYETVLSSHAPTWAETARVTSSVLRIIKYNEEMSTRTDN